ncbi:sigma-70 family RNA polymerase sigma factor [Glycomyces buryatensis]|uniref:Sigma-70 family RNA polymerase sigma factor n=1 Tax=Glycomyces buryatensis TaxID=2570927 RepID=A0A4S8QDA0_9ACTN|nr:sigma-70 family RNA polymerase sigma factor [Glycomyces buryatensis]THV42537.1 sigma-70 family RNA polymerase sigma factor [Glycomyces buryatensis]
MDREKILAERFEEHRDRLRAIAYRMLGSLSEAEDAVQETWLKAARADTTDVENLAGWLTTVVGRVCLDMLRSRKARDEDLLEERDTEPKVRIFRRVDPEEEALLADSVGNAMLVVLDALSPAERLAFVLHDVFSVPFADIAPIVERSPETTQRLASRARRRVRGKSGSDDGDRLRRYRAVEAFLRAAREGEFEELLSLLDPNVSFSQDAAARLFGTGADLVGAQAVAEQFSGSAYLARPVLLDGEAGVVVAPRGKVLLVMKMKFVGDRIAEIHAIAGKDELSEVELRVL